MFKTVMLSLCMILVGLLPGGSSVQAQEDVDAQELGESLVSALKDQDLVAYSQCWLGGRQALHALKDVGVEMPAEDQEGLRQYYRDRNRAVVESFEDIQALIEEKGIARADIELVKCTAQQVQEEDAPKGKLKQAGGFEIVMKAGGDEWRLGVDDGAFIGGLWYCSDRPVNLFYDEEVLSFEDYKETGETAVD